MRSLTVRTLTWDDDENRYDPENIDAAEVDVETWENPTPAEVVEILRKLGVEFGAVNSPAAPMRQNVDEFYADAALPDGSREYYAAGVRGGIAVPVPKVEEISARVEGFSELTTRVIIARVDAR